MRPLSIAGAAYRALARSRWRFIVQRRVLQRLRIRLTATRPGDVHELLDALASAGVRAHVSGGWGIDALLGRQTRRHADLDIVVRADVDGVEPALRRLGYRPVPELARRLEHPLMSDRMLLRDGRGHEVDVHSVAPTDWYDLERRQAFVTGRIAGRAVSCISWEKQEETHRGYDLRAKDHADLELLREGSGAGVAGPASVLLVPVPAAAPVCITAPGGLPPHVTVLYPFMGSRRIDTDVVRDLESVLGAHAPFDFALTAIGRFAGVLYLAPEPAERFRALTQACVDRWPQHPPYEGAFDEIVPHLTLAEGTEPPDLAARAAALLPLRVRATEVWLMTQGQGAAWKLRVVVQLRG